MSPQAKAQLVIKTREEIKALIAKQTPGNASAANYLIDAKLNSLWLTAREEGANEVTKSKAA